MTAEAKGKAGTEKERIKGKGRVGSELRRARGREWEERKKPDVMFVENKSSWNTMRSSLACLSTKSRQAKTLRDPQRAAGQGKSSVSEGRRSSARQTSARAPLTAGYS